MSQPIISLENISKKYAIGKQQSYGSLRESISELFSVGQKKSKRSDFWALDGISFEVAKGESFGVIGRNGAGKSTLLKILSQITPPTTGRIKMRGRVAALLEVGTGFHPQLTGRENIYLNGAILGMARTEITSKLDEIIAFSGVEKFLDTPVKHYSSGMYVRLAFAVAAHLEPEILIVDEVLSVGDTEFQKKCLGKMEEVIKQDGRTILFVSHNLVTVQSLCKKAILLEQGKIKKIGTTSGVIDTYLNERSSLPSAKSNLLGKDRGNVGEIRFTDMTIVTADGSGSIQSNDKLYFMLNYSSDFEEAITDARVVITVTSERSQQVVLRLDSEVAVHSFGNELKPCGTVICETDAINLAEGKYFVEIDFLLQGTSCDNVNRAAEFEVRTSLKNYGYCIFPDNTVCDHVIKYLFKQ